MPELQLKQRFDEVVQDSEIQIGQDLYDKATLVISEIERRYQAQGRMTHADAEAIYGWRYRRDGDHWYGLVPALLDEQDFRTMALLCFRDPTWLARLLEPTQGAEHIHAVNQLLGRRIALLLAETGTVEADILDLGAGTLGTLIAAIESTIQSTRRLDVSAVDLTPELLTEARKKGKLLEAKYGDVLTVNVLPAGDMVAFLRTCEPASVDAVTASFSIHHLHPQDQIELVKLVYSCLRPGGAFLMADPQEGKSAFNLENLILREPEGVFAAFAPPGDMLQLMADAGFSCEEPLALDSERYLAYALVAIKA